MVDREQDIGGFEKRVQPYDEWVGRLREKHGLSQDASLKDIEPVATKLLGDPTTAIDAAELVLNRRVDGEEKMIAQLIFIPGLSAEERFGLLLMERQSEELMRQRGETDFGTTKRLELGDE